MNECAMGGERKVIEMDNVTGLRSRRTERRTEGEPELRAESRESRAGSCVLTDEWRDTVYGLWELFVYVDVCVDVCRWMWMDVDVDVGDASGQRNARGEWCG
jgi:hypothetical protein